MAKAWYQAADPAVTGGDIDQRVIKMLDRLSAFMDKNEPLNPAKIAALTAPHDRGNDGWVCASCSTVYAADGTAPDGKKLKKNDFTCINAIPQLAKPASNPDPSRCRGRLLAINPQSDHPLWEELIRGVPGAPHLPTVADLNGLRGEAVARGKL